MIIGKEIAVNGKCYKVITSSDCSENNVSNTPSGGFLKGRYGETNI